MDFFDRSKLLDDNQIGRSKATVEIFRAPPTRESIIFPSAPAANFHGGNPA
jgi:hypothetical protein